MDLIASHMTDSLSGSFHINDNNNFPLDLHFPKKKKVKCVIDVATSTNPFIGDFITDHIPPTCESMGSESGSSPVFFKSSSTSHETVYERSCEKIKESSEVCKARDAPPDAKHTDSNVVTSTYTKLTSDQAHMRKLSNASISDTFEYLFVPKNGSKKIDQVHSPRQSAHRLVNFDNLTFQVIDELNVSNSFRHKTIANRAFNSFFYPRPTNLGDTRGTDESSITKTPKQFSEVSELPNPTYVLKEVSFLPSNPEGDTCDSRSEMIKIYPRESESRSTRQQLFNYLHHQHEESVHSQYSTLSDSTKVKSEKVIKKVVPQKIFTNIHSYTDEKKKRPGMNRLIQIQSIEIMTLFHRTISNIED